MSQTTLKCRVRKSGTGYEGTVSVPGLKDTKLIKRDESTVYANQKGVTTAAKAVADRLGLELEVEGNAQPTTTATRTRTQTPRVRTSRTDDNWDNTN